MTSSFTRTVEGREMPLPGTYDIDPVHSGVGFEVQYLGLSTVRGRFNDFAGTITVAEVPGDSAARVTIQAASVDTNKAQRDAHLRSDDFFGAETYPVLEFASSGMDLRNGEEFRLYGDLTIRGTSEPVVLAVEFHGAGPDLLGDASQPRIGFSASTTLNREAFGITFNQALETGGWLIGKQVHVVLDLQAARRCDPERPPATQRKESGGERPTGKG
ncbi:YceI family protein [Flindersiella endophytica]